MVTGAGGTSGPGGGAIGREFVIEAMFPPTGPEVFEPFAGFRRGGFVEGGREKSGGAEDDGFAVFGRMLVEFGDRETLREEAHESVVRAEEE